MEIIIILSIVVLGASSKTPGLSVSVSRGHGLTVKDIVVKRGKGEWESITGTCRACCQKSCSEISVINKQQSKIDREVEAIVNMTKTREDAVRDFETDLQAEIHKVKKLLKEVERMTNRAKPTEDAIVTTEEPLLHITSVEGGNNGNNEHTDPPSTTTPAPKTTTEPKEPWELVEIPLKHPRDYIRLTGGKNQYEGRLEVLFNGTWGTVCEDRWNITIKITEHYSQDIQRNNKKVACKQLGFGEGLLWQSQDRGNREDKAPFEFNAINDGLPAIVDELMCEFGDEKDLYECGCLQRAHYVYECVQGNGINKFWGVETIRKENERWSAKGKANDCYPKDDVYLRCAPPSRA